MIPSISGLTPNQDFYSEIYELLQKHGVVIFFEREGITGEELHNYNRKRVFIELPEMEEEGSEDIDIA